MTSTSQKNLHLKGKSACSLLRRLQNTPHIAFLLAFLYGCSIWYVPFYVALPMLLLSCLYAFFLNVHQNLSMHFLKTAACFIAFWAFGKFFFTLYNSSYPTAFFETLNFCTRISSVFCIALPFIYAFTPYELAFALGSMLKKIAPTRYWLLPLALLIMFTFLAEIARVFTLQRQILQLRGKGMGILLRIKMSALALFLTIAAQTWDRAVAVATRNLDHPSAWE